MNEVLHERKTLRHKHFDYNEGVIFITICTAGRKPILSRIVVSDETKQMNFVGDGNLTALRDVEAPSPTGRQNLAIPRFVSALKRLCNKEIGENVFQRSYFDELFKD